MSRRKRKKEEGQRKDGKKGHPLYPGLKAGEVFPTLHSTFERQVARLALSWEHRGGSVPSTSQVPVQIRPER